MSTFDESIKKIIHTDSPESIFYLSTLKTDKEKSEFLVSNALSLLKDDMSNSFKKMNLNNDNKVIFINEVFNKFNKIKSKSKKNGITDKLKTFINESEINSFKSRCSKINNFIQEGDVNDSRLVNEIYNLSISLSKKMNAKRMPLELHHYDIFKYLIDKNVSSEFRENTIKKIEGDYLIFRNSERNSGCINISLIQLNYCYINNVFSFESKRKASLESNKLEDISTKGIFLKNSASTFVFLCRSVTSSKFAFIETITVLSARQKKDENYIVALFNGEIMSNNDYDNRPFSSKAVLIKIEKKLLVKRIENSNILMDHYIDYIKKIANNISSESTKNNIDEVSLKEIKENTEIKGNLYSTLQEINNITSLNLILSKIKNEVDKHFNVMILKN